MRTILAAIMPAILFLAATAEAGTRTTTRGKHPACVLESYLDEIARMSQSGDDFGIKKMFESKRCIILKPGLRLSVLRLDPAKDYGSGLYWPGRARIRVYLPDGKDITLWTYAIEIESKQE